MIEREDVVSSFESMVDEMMSSLFLSRAAHIKSGVFTEEFADEIIKERSNYYLEKYGKMELEELRIKMLFEILGSELLEKISE